jgi:hypothetical protein
MYVFVGAQRIDFSGLRLMARIISEMYGHARALFDKGC